MRISQRQMFSTYTTQMNTSLSRVMDSNNQAGTGRRVNRPSDDPASMGRVLSYRSSLSDISRFKTNIGEASGWLNLMDYTLMGVDEVITKIKTLSLQGSTGTYDDDNREQIGYQLREYLSSLIDLANTSYNGQYIFAGHKTGEAPFREGLGVTCHDDALSGADFVVQGGAGTSVTIQFVEDGGAGTALNPDTGNFDRPKYIYSMDGGKTWEDGEWSSADTMMVGASGVTVKIVPETAIDDVTAAGQDKDNPNDKISAGGTWLTVRPTVVYTGDDNKIEVTQQYLHNGNTGTATKAEGHFTRDVSVRIDSVPDPLDPNYDPDAPMLYSYSLDNGLTWTQAKAPQNSEQLAVPGGYLKINQAGDEFQAKDQFVIHPHRANLNFEISPQQTITVNKVGKDIFGGLFKDPYSDAATPVAGPNLFETVGKLIGYANENDSEGFGKAMDELTDCLKLVTTHLAEVGGRENRLDVAYQTLSMRELSEYDAMSTLENVDTIELMTKLAQQQLTYNTVLKSSSMIMQMSLMNFI